MIVLNIISYIIYLFVCIKCVRGAKTVTGSPISITSMFVLPYMIICSFQEFVSLVFGYFETPSAEYWIINIVFILATCITELLLTKLERHKNVQEIKKVYDNFVKRYKISKVFFLLCATIIIVTAIVSIKMASTIDMVMLLQDDFQDDFNSSAGGNFYIRLTTMILAVYFLGINRSKIGYVLGILCFVPHIIINTKGILFIPIVATLLTRIVIGRVTNLRKTFLILGFAGSFIFFFSYMMEYFTYGENPLTDLDRWQYIGEKLIVYLTAGVQEFYINVRDGIEHNPMRVNITMTPLHNILVKFGIGKSISSINEEFNRLFGTLPHYGKAYSNVNGYIGTLYLFNGFLGALLYHVYLIILTFIIKIKAYSCKRPFWIVLYSLFLSAFFLAWFDFYFMQTFWTYFIILTVIFDIVYKFYSKKLKYDI